MARCSMEPDAPSSSDEESANRRPVPCLRGVNSMCVLLSSVPSSTADESRHPLSGGMSEEEIINIIEEYNIAKMQNSGEYGSAGDSGSSEDSNSVVQDPVSAQLINNISMLDYQTLSTNDDLVVGQPEGCKINGNLPVNNRKLPKFVNWNWVIIRKVLLWVVLSGLVACLGAIIAMVITIPKSCDPDLPWHQGKVFYEVFPASFKDSNDDGFGDFRGLTKKLDYIKDLGCNTVRLNYIFEAQDYPENYNNATYLLKVDRSLGNLKDFQDLVKAIHDKEMYIIMDIPVLNMIGPIEKVNANHSSLLTNDTKVYFGDMSAAITFWSQAQNVDGFYLKNLENFVNDVNYAKSLQIWKQIIGSGKILIASEKALQSTKSNDLTVFLNRIDLIDVHLDLDEGIKGLKKHIDKVVFGTLKAKAHYPWILWNVGNVNSERISSRYSNNTLALTALEMALPGTISLFYGDEIGLKGLSKNEVEKDFHEYNKIHNLVSMTFSGNNESAAILPWNSKATSGPRYHYLNVIKKFIETRLKTPTIYMRAIFKDGTTGKNMKIRITEENLVIIECWYPRRNSCVFIGNFGADTIATDLSSMFYSGTVMASTNSSFIGQVLYFENVTFSPNSAMLLKLEK